MPADFPYERQVDAQAQERHRRRRASTGSQERLRELLARGSQLAEGRETRPGRRDASALDRRLSEDHERLSSSGAQLGEVTGGWVCLARNLETGRTELVLALEYAAREEGA